MSEPVIFERDGDVAVIIVNNPPINAGSLPVRRGLLAAIQALESDASLCAGVIIGAGTTFIAGSDLREFGQPLQEPQLPAVIAALEACAKPVVAALHGAALGGGFELALGCDARIASPGTVVGLPEVTLGFIPGAGGTQRLPRLVGISRAIRMICAGERVPADEARRMGLVDAVEPGSLRDAAVRHARALAGVKSLVSRLPVPRESDADIEAAAAQARKAGRDRPAVLAAIEAVKACASVPIEQALARERAVFQEMRLSREARALRHQFFAEREAVRRPQLAGLRPRAIARVVVIGAGTMGAGIAIAALDAGFPVHLLDRDEAAVDRGQRQVHDHYASRVAAGKLTPDIAQACQARLDATSDWNVIGQADLVIEAVFEDLAVNQAVFRRIDEIARPGALLATNTSYLDIDAIAAATQRPHDVIGLHFFSPAHVMRLVEVVRGKASSPQAQVDGLQFARQLRKLSVLAGNGFGFIGNRIYSAYRRQCEFMIEEGAWPEQVDEALEALGLAMGPFAVADLSGLDIAWRMRQAQAQSRDPAARYVTIPDRLCEAGRLGRKTGAGYYRYEQQAGGLRRVPDPQVREIIAAARAGQGVAARALEAQEIQRRALLAMVNEAALLLAQGIAARASDIDVVLVNGYGFPKWEGGPVFWARERGAQALAQDLDWLAQVSGPGFVRGDIGLLLAQDAPP